VGDGLELVKTPAKKVTDTSEQCEINQSQHSQVLADLPPVRVLVGGFGPAIIGANRKRSVFFVKHVRISPQRGPVNDATLQSDIFCYGWILSVHKNSQVAVALIATETAKSEISVTVIVGGPFPVSKRNIHGRRIMA
jgi:hypothetical protein